MEESESSLKDGSDKTTKMSLTNLIMKVLGPGSFPVCAILHVLNYPLIVLVDCHLIDSPYLLVVSVENIQDFKFPAQKLL